jgi:hypothetical protein
MGKRKVGILKIEGRKVRLEASSGGVQGKERCYCRLLLLFVLCIVCNPISYLPNREF